MAQVVENKVQLGCGSLILIALIVMFLSNRGDRGDDRAVRERLDRSERQLDALDKKLESVEKKIDAFIVKP